MQLRCFLLDVDYVTLNGRAVIRLWLKDERGQNIIAYDSSFEPYFYAVTDDARAIMSVASTRSGEEIKPNRVERVVRKDLSLIHISEPTRRTPISYAVFCLKKK